MQVCSIHRFCLTSLLLLTVHPVIQADEPNTKLLGSFIPPADKLPKSIKEANETPGPVKEGIELTIPGVTTDQETITWLLEELVREEFPKPIEGMLLAFYQDSQDERFDMGLVGWQMGTDEAAEKMHELVKKLPFLSENPDRFKTYRVKNYVFMLFRDEGISDEGFETLIAHVEQTLKNVKAKP